MDPTPFTPITAAAGGLLVALAATTLMLGLGRIAGISGIIQSVLIKNVSGRGWRLAFLLGLMGSAWLVFHLGGFEFELRSGYPRGLLIGGGLLVGYGTTLGSGCTSGHGVCGLARFSRRSLVATLIFIGVGMATVWVMRQLIGGAL